MQQRRFMRLKGMSQKHIADRLGLSQSTVSLVLNNDPQIGEQTRKRVLQAIEEVDYQPHGIARSFAGRRTGNIGFVLCHKMISNPLYVKKLQGVDQEVSRHGRKLLFSSAEEFLAEKSKFPVLLKEKVLDGAIVCGKVSDEFVAVMRSRGVPTVLLGCYDIEGVDIVSGNNRKGAFDAVSYLISLGHRKIGYLTGSFEYYSNRELLDGYKEAHREAGLDFDERLVLMERGEDVPLMVEKVLGMPEQDIPTAILAANDMVAIRALDILRGKGFRIPDDMSITGFHDIDMASYTSPRLTTVKIFDEAMAAAAVERLIQIIEDPEQEPVRKIIDTELVVRESCCPPGGEGLVPDAAAGVVPNPGM